MNKLKNIYIAYLIINFVYFFLNVLKIILIYILERITWYS